MSLAYALAGVEYATRLMDPPWLASARLELPDGAAPALELHATSNAATPRAVVMMLSRRTPGRLRKAIKELSPSTESGESTDSMILLTIAAHPRHRGVEMSSP